MLQAVPGDAPVDTHLGVVVARDTLPLLIGPLPVLPEACISPQCTPLRSPTKADLQHVGIVNGDCPCGGRRPIDGRCSYKTIGRRGACRALPDQDRSTLETVQPVHTFLEGHG